MGEIHLQEGILRYLGVNCDHSNMHKGNGEEEDTGRTIVFFYLSTCLTRMKKEVNFKCYSSEKLIALNTPHEGVPTWQSFHS